MKKRCQECIITQLNPEQYECKKDLDPRECIGKLQGFIELLMEKHNWAPSRNPTGSVKVDYSIDGVGTLWFPKDASDEEIAMAILDDCPVKEFCFEYTTKDEEENEE